MSKAQLLRRFPGIMNQTARAAGEMADYTNKSFAPYRTWIDIQPERPRDHLPSPWVAWICGKVHKTGQEFRYPLIPDAHNPRADKRVSETDKPTTFSTLLECEIEADAALRIFDAQLSELVKSAA